MTILLDLTPEPNGYAALRCPYDERAVAQFKTIPGIRWDPGERVWKGPAEAAAAVGRILEKACVVKLRDRLPQPPAPIPCGDADLYGYQQEGVGFLKSRIETFGAALLADEPGVGKSVQALRALADTKRVLVLCPAVVVEHWREEIKKWLGLDSVRLGKGEWNKFAVCSYDTFRGMLRPDAPELPQAEAIVLDEIHYLSHSSSQRSKAVKAYNKAAAPKIKIGLSGTPMLVRPKDLFNPLDLLFPGRFGTWFGFTRRYADGHFESIKGAPKEVWQHNGASNLDELAERLKPLMLRRTRRQVLPDLPDRQRIVLPVEVPADAARNLSKAYAELSDGEAVREILQAVEIYKTTAACALVGDLVTQGRRPLVYTTRRHVAEEIAKKLGCPYVTGETPPHKRREKLLSGTGPAVATLFSVTTGINLIEFDTAVFVGLDWVPSVMLQSEARLSRVGQTRSVLYYYLVGIGTVDEVIRSRVIERLEHFSTLVGTEGDDADMAKDLGTGDEDLIGQIIAMVQARARQ